MKQPTKNSIELRGVSKTYDLGQVKVHALRDVSITIEQGELVSLVGPSGSGKSTLFNIMGLLDTPTAGLVHVNGVDVSSMNDEQRTRFRSKQVGLVFQFYNLVPVLSAVENVMLPLAASKLGRSEQVERATRALETVGLEDRIHHRPHELSGGEQQRACIARATVTRPAIILADEPTGNLDQDKGRAILDLFTRMNHETGQGFMVITHDPSVASWAARAVHMEDGTIISDTHQAGSREERVEAVPVTARALASIQQRGAGTVSVRELASELDASMPEVEHVIERLVATGRIAAHLEDDRVIIDRGGTRP